MLKPVFIGAFLIAVATAAGLAWHYLRLRAARQDYLQLRASEIRSELDWAAGEPVIFIGDSITEAAPLPAKVCEHPTVNGGISGIDTLDYLSVISKIGDFGGAAIVVALGTNDARKGHGGDYAQDYRTLLKAIESRSRNLLLVGIPPIDNGRVYSAARADRINTEIRTIAEQTGHPFIDLRSAMVSKHPMTIDGVHPSAAGYELWLKAIVTKVAAGLGCEP
jgi:lysophospholipase L1-like esterase